MAHFVESMSRDFGYAVRTLRKNPGFTAVAILTLALGAGANAAIFSLFEAIVLRSLPVPDPQELYTVQISARGNDSAFSQPVFEQMRAALPQGARLTAMTSPRGGRLSTAGGVPEEARFQLVSSEFFEMLRAGAAAGRLLAPGEQQPVAVLSHRYWLRRWSGASEIVGSVIHLNGQPLTIIGIAQPGFEGTHPGALVDLWLPLSMQPNVRYRDNVASYGSADTSKPWATQENLFWLEMMARVGPGANVAQVTSAVDVVLKRSLERVHGKEPDAEARRRYLSLGIQLIPGNRGLGSLRDRFLTPLNGLMLMSALVLLIACANLASLLMSRAQARRREIAVRLSVGASRGRVVRQLLIESLLLSAAGCGLGMLTSTITAPGLLGLISGGPPGIDLSPNPRFLFFNTAVTALAAIAFGLAPALRSTRFDLVSALKTSRTDDFSGHGFTRFMISAQVAFSTVLLVLAAFLGYSLRNLLLIDPGYQASRLLSVRIDPHLGGYKESELLPLYDRLEQRLGGLPGVRSVSISLCPLATGCGQYGNMYGEGFVPKPGEKVQVQELFVGTGYIKTMGLRLLRGRDFTAGDSGKSPRVIIVNQTFARQNFGHDDVAGRRAGYGIANPTQFQIVGVIEDMPVNNLRESVPRFVLHPIRQNAVYARNIDVRANGDPATLAAAVRSALHRMEPNLPVYSIRTMTEQIGLTLTRERTVVWLSVTFSLLAAILACIGVYGLVAYSVARRTAEIGVRMALGAKPSSVQWLVLKKALSVTVGGIAAGVAFSALAVRSLEQLLFGVKGSDWSVYVVVAMVLTICACAAGALPARRAALIPPSAALRAD